MKIKNIRIKAFRLFKDEEVDLSSRKNRDVASNFVSLYAPNGFGKTSFFDAMEFCMTRRIQRIGHENFKENFSVDQKQNGLTFIHNSYLPNENINIEMTFEDRNSESISCTPDEEKTVLMGDVKNSYFQNAILSQDWFSEFLSTKSSADRFRIFMSYFSETEDLLSYHDQIRTSIVSVGHRIGKLSDKIKEKNREIDKTIDDSVFQKISAMVELLKKWNLKISWQNVMNIKTLNTLQLEAESLLNGVRMRIDSCKHLSNNLNKIIFESDNLINIERLVSYKQNIETKIEDLQNIKEHLNKIYLLKNKLSLIANNKTTLSETENLLARLNYLLDNYEAFMGLQRLIVQDGMLLKQLETRRSTQITLNKEKTTQLQSLNDLFLLATNRKEEFVKEIEELHDKYMAYEALLTEQKEKKIIETDLIEQNHRLKLALDVLQGKANKLEKLKNSLLRNAAELIDGVFEEETQFIIVKQNHLKKWNEDLTKLKQSIKEKNDFNSDLQKLIVNSRNLLSELKGGVCPLCGHDYVLQEMLLKNISENTAVANAIEHDVQRKEELIESIEEQEKALSECYASLIEKVDIHITEVFKQIEEAKSQHIFITTKLQELTTRFMEIVEIITIQYSKFIQMTEVEVRKNFDLKVEIENKKLSELDKQRQPLNDELVKINKEINQLSNNIEEIHLRITKFETNPLFIEYRSYVGTNNVTEQDQVEWKQQQQQMNNKIYGCRNELAELTVQISILQREGIKLEEEAIVAEKLTKVNGELEIMNSRFTTTLAYLKNDCLIDVEDTDVNLNVLKASFHEKVSNNDAVLKAKKECEKDLLNYLYLLELGLKYNENEKHRKELEKLKADKTHYSDNKKALINEKERLEKYLGDYVKRYFQLDLINRLYNIIDPHPEYKEIRFECDFKNKAPKLNILMNSVSNGKRSIVPNLYFSTAQINILSFCIFLAKALFAKTDTGEDMDCIFIDDPIQALDDINILSMIDLLRNVAFSLNKQIVLTTHDRNFFELLKKKVPEHLFNSRFLQLRERGVFAEG